jgi:hypothetical protein
MKSFYQYITEVFDNPYKWRGGNVAKGSITPKTSGIRENYVFKTADGGRIELTASHFWRAAGLKISPQGLGIVDIPDMTVEKEGHAVAIAFSKENAGETTFDMTGEGDEFRILATVLDIINAIIKKHVPALLYFSGDKDGKEKGGRVGAYKAIIKRFAGKAGYESITKEYSDKVSFQLVKK